MFLVEKPRFMGHEFSYENPTGGKLVGKSIPTIGYRGMHSFDLSFEELFVPDAALVGGDEGQGKGFYNTMAGLSGGRIQTAARASGVMQAAIERAVRGGVRLHGRSLLLAHERERVPLPQHDLQRTEHGAGIGSCTARRAAWRTAGCIAWCIA